MRKILFLALFFPCTAFGQAFPPVPYKPDPMLTPGLFNDPPTPLAILCDHGNHPTSGRRNVSAKEKKLVLKEYGISFAGMDKDQKKAFRKTIEIDHLIPLELDGNNGECRNGVCDLRNLWPQTHLGTRNAEMKDHLENVLSEMVCHHDITLRQAQIAIATDWYSAYVEYVGE